MSDEELVWEHIRDTQGLQLRAAKLEDTEDGWHCVAVELAQGSMFESSFVEMNCRFTIAVGTGVLWHDNKTKNYQPMQHFIVSRGASFGFRQVWEDTRFAITWPPPLQVV